MMALGNAIPGLNARRDADCNWLAGESLYSVCWSYLTSSRSNSLVRRAARFASFRNRDIGKEP